MYIFLKECGKTNEYVLSAEIMYALCWKFQPLNLCTKFAENAEFLSFSDVLKTCKKFVKIFKCWI